MCNNFNKKFLDEAAKAQLDKSESSELDHSHFMNEATKVALKGIDANEGGPFGCVIVKDGKIVGKGNNKVTSTNDPTAHGEIVAIRNAWKNLNSFELNGCILYTSCEPCPMCLGAIYWSRISKVYYGTNQKDAAGQGFDDAFIYKEIPLEHAQRKIPFKQCAPDIAIEAFKKWHEKEDKIMY